MQCVQQRYRNVAGCHRVPQVARDYYEPSILHGRKFHIGNLIASASTVSRAPRIRAGRSPSFRKPASSAKVVLNAGKHPKRSSRRGFGSYRTRWRMSLPWVKAMASTNSSMEKRRAGRVIVRRAETAESSKTAAWIKLVTTL